LLSVYTLAGPSIGTPKDFNLILNADIKSRAIRIATSLDQYVLDSHVF
jgi:hypothetical protein